MEIFRSWKRILSCVSLLLCLGFFIALLMGKLAMGGIMVFVLSLYGTKPLFKRLLWGQWDDEEEIEASNKQFYSNSAEVVNDNEKDNTEPIRDKNEISPIIFNELKGATSKIKKFVNQLEQDARVQSELKDNENEPKQILFSYIICDIVKCFFELNYELSPTSHEGQSLILTYLRFDDENIEYNEFVILLKHISDWKKNIIDDFDECIEHKSELLNNDFLILSLLKFDRDLKAKYLTLLHRYMLLVVKSDNEITDIESKWLNKLSCKREELLNSPTQPINDKKEEKVLEETEKDPFEELSKLIGLSSVKTAVNNLSNLIKVQKMRESRGMKATTVSYHCVFTGNPGTGKTTVARIVARIYKQLGVLKKGHLVETDRSGLVAEYIGQTAPKTNEIIDSALDGVLFIDEAYSLVQDYKNDFGYEAISTLLKRMEDDRDRLVVILAGYSKEMEDFMNSNSGLQSRFNNYIEFPDYSVEELVQVFEYTAKKNDFLVSESALSKVKEVVQEEVANKNQKFGNARFVRNLFEKIITEQANRLMTSSLVTDEMLSRIEEIDVLATIGSFQDKDCGSASPNKKIDISFWDYSIKSWEDAGWKYEKTDDGFIVKSPDDNEVYANVGLYKGHYYIQARFQNDSNFSTQLKQVKGGYRHYGQWWKYLDAPYYHINAGELENELSSNAELQKYIVYSINDLMNDLMEYKQKLQ